MLLKAVTQDVYSLKKYIKKYFLQIKKYDVKESQIISSINSVIWMEKDKRPWPATFKVNRPCQGSLNYILIQYKLAELQ